MSAVSPAAVGTSQLQHSFPVAVLRAVNWRAIFITQGLGLLFALEALLLNLARATPGFLVFQLQQQAIFAACVMLAALAGDEAVRHGWRVWHAFVVMLLCASLAAALLLWAVAGPGLPDHAAYGEHFLRSFFGLGIGWGVALMVYLNRESARRILAGVRAGELARLEAERRLVASRLAAAEAQIDPQLVTQQLLRVRDLYAAGSGDADARLDELIAELRRSSTLAVAAAEGAAP